MATRSAHSWPKQGLGLCKIQVSGLGFGLVLGNRFRLEVWGLSLGLGCRFSLRSRFRLDFTVHVGGLGLGLSLGFKSRLGPQVELFRV